jgi:hypothetical protein
MGHTRCSPSYQLCEACAFLMYFKLLFKSGKERPKTRRSTAGWHLIPLLLAKMSLDNWIFGESYRINKINRFICIELAKMSSLTISSHSEECGKM